MLLVWPQAVQEDAVRQSCVKVLERLRIAVRQAVP